MIDTVKIILSRIVLILSAGVLVFPLYFFIKGHTRKFQPVKISENFEIQDKSVEKEIASVAKKTEPDVSSPPVKVKKLPSSCELNKYLNAPAFNYIIPLNPDGIISTSFSPEPAGINFKIKPDKNKAERYHLAGSICLGKALILKSFFETKKWPEKLPFNKPDPGNEDTAFKTYIECAINWFTALRPLPPYKKWSEAMYLNAWALSLLNRHEEAKKFLTIPAKTQSKSFPAKLSRFALEIINARNGLKPIIPSDFVEFKNYSTFINYYNTLYFHKNDRAKNIQTISFEIERFHTINRDVFGSLISELTTTCLPGDHFETCMKSILNYCRTPLCRSTAFWYSVGFITRSETSKKQELLSIMCRLKGKI
ncbi:hypothetical protein KKF34_00355 [Myxococcota bacterium]|nr:hypothetical protein [Myxococcota bacterium]MBU1380324.1 hypothetical protein [Myxococcota bacterium]MBU1495312.1 hypothetical protein [Myxococcota bacterium]